MTRSLGLGTGKDIIYSQYELPVRSFRGGSTHRVYAKMHVTQLTGQSFELLQYCGEFNGQSSDSEFDVTTPFHKDTSVPEMIVSAEQ